MSAGLLLTLALVGGADAPEPAPARLPVDLAWAAPAECPSGEEVEAELARIARVRPGFAPVRLTASVEIRRVRGELHLELRTERDGRRGSRQLRSPDCAALVRGVTLVLALALGPGVELRSLLEDAPLATRPPSPPGRAATSTASGASAVVFEEPASPDPDSPWSVAAEGRLGFGWLPEPALGFGLLAGWAAGDWGLGVLASVWLPASERVGPAVEAQFWAATLAALVCAHPLRATLRISACIGPEVGGISGAGEGTARDQGQLAPWYGGRARLELGLEWDLPLRPYVSGDLSVGAYRPRFEVAGAGAVHELPFALPALAVGVLIAL